MFDLEELLSYFNSIRAEEKKPVEIDLGDLIDAIPAQKENLCHEAKNKENFPST